MDLSPLAVTNNPAESRFEAFIGDKMAFVAYIEREKLIVFTHTEVPIGLEGQGIGGKLARTVLDYARQIGKPVLPQCPYILSYIRKHKEYQDLVLPGFGRFFQ
jgi:predicted GNAT family acetyltransferase